jgi:hypothetical protein
MPFQPGNANRLSDVAIRCRNLSIEMGREKEGSGANLTDNLKYSIKAPNLRRAKECEGKKPFP